jgi:hypothetical protein
MDEKEVCFLACTVMKCYIYVYWRDGKQGGVVLLSILCRCPSTFDCLVSNSTSNLTEYLPSRTNGHHGRLFLGIHSYDILSICILERCKAWGLVLP